MTEKDDDKKILAAEQAETTAAASVETKQKEVSTMEQIRQNATEDDDAPVSSLTLRKILGGDMLSSRSMRQHVWFIIFIGIFITVYVASRYQCQQDMLDIAQMEEKLQDAKYRALSSSSALTERCRESHVLEALRNNKDSVLHVSERPPYIIKVPEE